MSKRILVVEDQPDSRQIIRDMLAPTDYEITEADISALCTYDVVRPSTYARVIGHASFLWCCRSGLSGVAGFEPATPSSRTRCLPCLITAKVRSHSPAAIAPMGNSLQSDADTTERQENNPDFPRIVGACSCRVLP